MEKLLKWLTGYVKLLITGARTERFLSLLKNKNIQIWKLEPVKDGYTFFIMRPSIRELDAIRKKTGVHIKVLEKIGLPFLLFRYRKRKMLVAGLLAGIGLVYTGTLFIWDINVDGTYHYSSEQIKTRIETQYVSLGMKKSEIDCDQLEEELRADFPDISWISCEMIGTQLNVVIKETLEGTETITDETKPQDIVAVKDGVIVEMITRSGMPIAKRGSVVSKGDILISGVVYIYDDYDAVIETDYVVADGDVIAETNYDFADSFEMQYYEKNYTGNTEKEWLLQIGSWTQSFHLPKKTFMNQDEVSETHQLCFGNAYYLPVSLTNIEQREYQPVLKMYSEQEAMERMTQRLERYLNELREKGVEIMENHVTIGVQDGVCSASGYVTVWERIGYGRPIQGNGADQEAK